jgi:hypothetical protein
VALVTAGAPGLLERAPAAGAACAAPATAAAYESRVRRALSSGRDVWGEQLLAAPGGPTLRGAQRFLAPLRLARGPRGARLTDSGVYYLPFALPDGPRGAGTVALHVADGSQILAQRAGERALTVRVGPGGRERYGECVRRLTHARLAEGWLPIVETGYTDAAGVRYRQESFAGRIPETTSLVSFVRLSVDARRASRAATVRFVPSVGGRAQLAFGSGGSAGPAGVAYRLAAGSRRVLYAAWLATPAPLRDLELDETTYANARAAVRDYWRSRLSAGMQVSVPEAEVMNAMRAVLVQNLALTYRYSIGNQYEQFSFPESVDVARVLAEYGFAPVSRSILRTSLTRSEERYPNWKRGERLIGSAQYARLSGDIAFVRSATPALRRFVDAIGRQLRAGDGGLLARERYSSDIPEQVYGLHAQAAVWEGLRAMAGVWDQAGRRSLAVRCRALADRLGAGLRRAVQRSQRRLADGSLFVPARLLDGERPYDLVVEERLGSYWNLVIPYALASGLFEPGGAQARGILRYLELHGARLLGIVRAGAYSLYGRDASHASGTNQVYNASVARFLADNDEADLLVLGLYGMLAAGMTPATFVSGEAASVTPLPGTAHRAMYLPPNSASNGAFLETLRAQLVHETRDAAGAPQGLRLAYATPRAWLRAGREIDVRDAPTSFGPVSFSIAVGASEATIELELPERAPRFLGVRLRLPSGTRIGRVEVDGETHRDVDRATGTIDLSGRTGALTIDVRLAR